MSNALDQNASQPTVYEIRIAGHLNPRWTGWFGDMSITLLAEGDTLLTGPVLDQAALYGLLNKARNLGMSLLSVNRVETSQNQKRNVNTQSPLTPLPPLPKGEGEL